MSNKEILMRQKTALLIRDFLLGLDSKQKVEMHRLKFNTTQPGYISPATHLGFYTLLFLGDNGEYFSFEPQYIKSISFTDELVTITI